MKTIEYGLIATSMTESQCQQIVKPIINRVMPKMKLARSLKRDVVHGPTSNLGVGIPNVYVMQIIEKVQAILDYGWKQKSHTGILLINAIEAHLLEIGLGGQIFSDMRGDDIVHLIDGVWMKHLIRGMWKFKIRINTNHATLQTWRDHDSFIMDHIIARRRGAGGYTDTQLKSINQCRRYLNVIVSVSDISNGYGSRILRWALECKKLKNPTHMSGMRYKWPPHGRPGNEDREIWKNALLDCLCSGRVGFLDTRLGKWNPQCTSISPWRYDHRLDRMFKKKNQSWEIYRPTTSTTRHRQFIKDRNLTTTTLPRHTTIPVIIPMSTNSCAFTGFKTVAERVPAPLRADYLSHWDELLNSPEFGWAIADITLHVPLPIIAQYIANNMGTFATDGSTDKGRSTSGFLMFNEDDFDLFEGGNYVPGRKSDQHSYRAELAGILPIVLIANYVCSKCNITGGTVTIACNNDSALWNSFNAENITSGMPSYDILSRIRKELANSPLTFCPQKVKGHQDRKTPYASLDKWGKANCRADKLAGKFMESHHDEIEGQFPRDVWTLSLDGTEIISNVKKELYDHCTTQQIRSYWASKNYFDHKNINGINWLAFEKAASNTQAHQRRWLTKHFAHNSATGKVMHQRKERNNDKCPICETATENTDHLITCMGNGMEETFATETDKLKKWLSSTTDQAVKEVIMEFLHSMREERDFTFKPTWGDDVATLARAQLDYGCRATIHGFLVHDWTQWHQDYVLEMKMAGIKPPPQPDTWVPKLIQHLWCIHFAMWCKRCEVAHGSEEKRIITSNGETIDEDLKTQYASFPHPRLLNSSERRILRIPLEKVTKFPVKRKLRLYRRNQRILESYHANEGAADLREWLVIPPPTESTDTIQQPTPVPAATPAAAPTRKRYNHQRSVNIMQEWLHRDSNNLDNIFDSIPEVDMNRINAAADGIPSPTPTDNPTPTSTTAQEYLPTTRHTTKKKIKHATKVIAITAYFSRTPTDTNRLNRQEVTHNTSTNENTSKEITDRQNVEPQNTNTNNNDTRKNTEID